MVQPQSIANQLTDRLNSVFGGPNLSELEVAKLRRDAKSLMQVDPERAYDALGMIAAVTFNVVDSIENHKRAIKLNPHSCLLNLNFSISLDRLGRTQQAIYYAERALECGDCDQEDSNYLHSILFELYFKAGLVKKAKLFRENVPVDESNAETISKLYEEICAVDSFMQKYAISDTDLSKYVSILEKFVTDRSLPCFAMWPFASESEEAALISLGHRLFGDVDLALELNLELSGYLAQQEVLPEYVTNLVTGNFLATSAA